MSGLAISIDKYAILCVSSESRASDLRSKEVDANS
jgi:hypothetical protein